MPITFEIFLISTKISHHNHPDYGRDVSLLLLWITLIKNSGNTDGDDDHHRIKIK